MWSCAAPVLMAPIVSPNSMSMSSSSHSSVSTTSLNNSGNCKKRDSLTALHNVGAAFRALLLFFERNGVARASVRELQRMIVNEQYILAMERAAEYIDCLLAVDVDLDSIIFLFVAAWESLRDYSRSLFKEAQKNYSRFENRYWLEFIERGTMSQADRGRRKRRQLDEYDPEKQVQLKQKLFETTRFKIDCEKNLIQTTEWSRILRYQQRRLRNAKRCNK